MALTITVTDEKFPEIPAEENVIRCSHSSAGKALDYMVMGIYEAGREIASHSVTRHDRFVDMGTPQEIFYVTIILKPFRKTGLVRC